MDVLEEDMFSEVIEFDAVVSKPKMRLFSVVGIVQQVSFPNIWCILLTEKR